MSIHQSFFSRNNTIISNNYVNTGRASMTHLFYGNPTYQTFIPGFSRFIFNIDLLSLQNKIDDKAISSDCQTGITHTLRMRNTSFFDPSLLNSYDSFGLRRATSFDLILFRIPLTSGNTGDPQYWDEGVGYDEYDVKKTLNSPYAYLKTDGFPDDKNYSIRPSNWYQTTTIDTWGTEGIYDNTNSMTGNAVHYSALTIIDTQHFEFGNEDIEFDMTNEINSILDGTLTGITGWGVAFKPEVENITGLTESFSVYFFSRHTNTFYEPYLLTEYDDTVRDDRNLFTLGKSNKLYLYVYDDGLPVNLDENPLVTIKDVNNLVVNGLSGLTSCTRTKGVYEITIPPITGYTSICQFYDVWSNIKLNGVSLSNITNEFTLYPYSKSIQIGTNTKEPDVFGFDIYGIHQDEKILNTDIRKVGVIIKKAYTTNQPLNKIEAFYRIYVREGQTEVQVQNWTLINKTPNEYYFMFDTRDKIPNEYFVDIKVNTSGQVDTYKRTLKFQIVNKK
jgi:hypothetical protein